MKTPQRPLTSMPDVLRRPEVGLGSDSSELLIELSIASARIESASVKLARAIKRPWPGTSQGPSGSSATLPTS